MDNHRYETFYKSVSVSSVIYIIGQRKDDIADKIDIRDSALVFVPVKDWNRDLSPYPQKAVFASGEDFSGGADEFYSAITNDIIKNVENDMPLKDGFVRSIAGYSLAGLFALHAFIKGGFAMAASASGSLWYPGFTEMLKNADIPNDAAVYLSLGDKESRTRNPMLKNVLEKTKEAHEILLAKGADSFFELNPGNHYANTASRLAKGINHIITASEKRNFL